MGSNPINLALRFALELAALISFGYWGWNASSGLVRFVLALGLPLIAALLWGTFAVPDDPSRSGKAPIPVPGIMRLFLEFDFFALAALAIADLGNWRLALAFGAIVVLHYIASYDRVAWLLRQR